MTDAAPRIMLYAKDRGCTRPGCDAPAYHSQVHHVKGWQATRRTDIDDLTLAPGPDNRLAGKGWATRTNARGETEWLPPATDEGPGGMVATRRPVPRAIDEITTVDHLAGAHGGI